MAYSHDTDMVVKTSPDGEDNVKTVSDVRALEDKVEVYLKKLVTDSKELGEINLALVYEELGYENYSFKTIFGKSGSSNFALKNHIYYALIPVAAMSVLFSAPFFVYGVLLALFFLTLWFVQKNSWIGKMNINLRDLHKNPEELNKVLNLFAIIVNNPLFSKYCAYDRIGTSEGSIRSNKISLLKKVVVAANKRYFLVSPVYSLYVYQMLSYVHIVEDKIKRNREYQRKYAKNNKELKSLEGVLGSFENVEESRKDFLLKAVANLHK